MLGRAPLHFPYCGLNSKKNFKSARMFFDTMFELAPGAFTEFAEFLLKYTAGRCGVHQVFDDSVLAELVEGKTTMKAAHDLFGWTGVMQRVPSGEIWTFRGSITHFDFPAGARRRQIGMCRTLERKLAIDFGPSEIAQRITIGDVEYFRPPRL